MTKTIL